MTFVIVASLHTRKPNTHMVISTYIHPDFCWPLIRVLSNVAVVRAAMIVEAPNMVIHLSTYEIQCQVQGVHCVVLELREGETKISFFFFLKEMVIRELRGRRASSNAAHQSTRASLLATGPRPTMQPIISSTRPSSVPLGSPGPELKKLDAARVVPDSAASPRPPLCLSPAGPDRRIQLPPPPPPRARGPAPPPPPPCSRRGEQQQQQCAGSSRTG